MCHSKPRQDKANLIFTQLPSNKQQGREQFTIANYDVSYIKVNFQDQLAQLQSQNLTRSLRNLVLTSFCLERTTHLLKRESFFFETR